MADTTGRDDPETVHITVRFADPADRFATEPWTNEDLRLPPRYTAIFDHADWPLVEVDLRVRNRQLEMEQVQFRRRPQGPRLQVTALRAVPLQSLIEDTIPILLTKVEETSPGHWKSTLVAFGSPRDARRSRIEANAVAVNRRRGTQPDRRVRAAEALKVWREAEDRDDEEKKRTSPVQYVMKALSVSRPVAYRLRAEGLAAEQEGAKRGRSRRKAK